jgi:hypothetical protein
MNRNQKASVNVEFVIVMVTLFIVGSCIVYSIGVVRDVNTTIHQTNTLLMELLAENKKSNEISAIIQKNTTPTQSFTQNQAIEVKP